MLTFKDFLRLRFMVWPVLFVLVCWLVEIIKQQGAWWITDWGVFPRTIEGLRGIIFYPLIHGSWEHLINNSVSFLVLAGLLFNLYGKTARQIFILSWLISGIWLWCVGRSAHHIGASGMIYAFASFHFFSGIVRWNPRLIVISLLIVFLYGYMVWGVLPTDPSVSFEGHLTGGLTGILLAISYRKEGPAKKRFVWRDEPEHEEPYWIVDPATDEKPFGENQEEEG